MVLPAPAPDTAPVAHAWLDRLSLVLRLAGRSVMVLVDRARPERLGELVRHLVRERPETEVLIDAPSLVTVAEGSTVVLCVRAIDADWLNQERPIVQARSLRLVLFSDEETTLHLARKAVDFYDWISHCIECPPGPPAFAVRALRRAACARAAAVVWQGGDLEGTFAEAFPGRTLAHMTADQSYAALLEPLRPRAKTWVAVTNLDRTTAVQRICWAEAEAGRLGRLVLVEPAFTPALLPRVGARALTIEEGAARLSAVGIEGAARLAALFELSPGAIDDAAKLAHAGVVETELSALALREADLAPALERAVQTRVLKEATKEDSSTDEPTIDLRGRFRLPPFPRRIELALRGGDLDLAAHWAGAWKKITGSARSIVALARIRSFQMADGDAQELLREAHDQIDNGTDDDTRFEFLRAKAMEYLGQGDYPQARRVASEARSLVERLGRDQAERDELYDLFIRCLIAAGHIKDAELTLNQWFTTLDNDGPLRWNPQWARAAASLKRAQGNTTGAAHLLEQLLTEWPTVHETHPTRAAMEQSLAQIWLEQGRFRDTEHLLRASIHRLDQISHPTTRLRTELGRALHGLGRFREAEQEFRRVMEEKGAGAASAEITRHDLVRSLSAQGRLDEAEALLDPSLVKMQRDGNTDSPLYARALDEKARIRRMRGDLSGAETMMREALRLQERFRGREHPRVLPTLVELSETLITLGKSSEAEPLLRRAAHLANKFGDRTGEAIALTGLARAQADLGFQHARSTALKSLDSWSRLDSEPTQATLRELEAIVAGALSPRKAPSRRRR